MSTSKPVRRPSVSIYEYPEDLNPFKDDEKTETDNEVVLRRPHHSISNEETSVNHKDSSKHKFWTFGRSKKKRSNSFSIKSTWNGLFGKKKDTAQERKPTISTVSSTYQRTNYNNCPEVSSNRMSSDQKEFSEALCTLARRRKCTLDNSSKYGSTLTVNGDSGRIYEGSPQETTASILNDLTPKPPARRFGQVSPKPTDAIPSLNYSSVENSSRSDEDCTIRTPIPPKRGGLRSSQRLYQEHHDSSSTTNMTDENENMHEDYVFKRLSHDAVRKSNLSINSCISMGSVYHSGRKKRRAPPPPSIKGENQVQAAAITVERTETTAESDVRLDESAEISRVAENIDDLTQTIVNDTSYSVEKSEYNEITEITLEGEKKEEISNIIDAQSREKIPEDSVNVELILEPEEPVEIIKDIAEDGNMLSKNDSLSSESFSVKDEIEKIERQIKLLESKQIRHRTSSYSNEEDLYPETRLERGGLRRSLQENRRNFFRELAKPDDQVKVELRKLPRKLNDIKVVHLGDSAVVIDSEVELRPKNAIKVIELHISEPILQKPECNKLELDINPLPKPKRHSTQQLADA